MRSSFYQYRFEVGEDGSLTGAGFRRGHKSVTGPIRVSLAVGQRLSALEELEPPAQDLMEVAAAVAAVDRLSPRCPDGSDHGWGRQFRVTLPVREPDFWTQHWVSDHLSELLGRLTYDDWFFDWTPRCHLDEPRASVSQPVLIEVRLPPTEFVLFSGGLDSFAGACNLLRDHQQIRCGLISVAVSDRAVGIQRGAHAALAQQFRERVWRIEAAVSTPPSVLRPTLHRVRPFLFQTMGAVIAHAHGARRLYQCENGIASLCLPASPSAMPWQTSLGVHPRTLREMGAFLSMVFGVEFRIENPYLFHTKAEMCYVLRELGLDREVGRTVSCDRFPQRVAGHPACGVCGPCILRRQSLQAAGLGRSDRADLYRYDVTVPGATLPRGIQRTLYAIQDQQARLGAALASAEPWSALTRVWPQLDTTAFEASRASGRSLPATRDEVYAMLTRFANEWEEFPLCLEFCDVVRTGDRRRIRLAAAVPATLPLLDRQWRV